ncbi:MAG TPA: ankyrin repeat domain-containing protein [Steroidobacteraceae bacterium]|nr:ankyrin repeat domain-containing protein [Steroidobacteraceae bacterium]
MRPGLFPLLFVVCSALAHGAESSSLLAAAYAGDAARVAALVRAGADVNQANEFGATPLSEAARRGDAAVLQLLLKAGADPRSVNADGETALMAVARTGNVAAARLLLQAGAQVDAREKWGGQTALIWAAAQDQPQMIRLLAAHGADVNARSAVREWERRVTAEGRPKDMNRGGLTPLMYAAREGYLDALRVLLAMGADVDLPDPDGSTPLILALMNGHFDAAKVLIDAGADVNLWDWWGQAPLYMAVDMNTLPTGARVELPTLDYATALDIAQMLLARGANPNARLKLRPPFRMVSQDRQSDPSIDAGVTPLFRAAKAADVPAIRLLLAHGAIVDMPNVFGQTPLMMACGVGRGNNPTRGGHQTEAQAIEAAKLLLAAGADVNARSQIGETPLHGAAIRGFSELAGVLAAAGGNLDAVDKDNMSPIDYAMGRFPTRFLESKPTPFPETAAALRKLGAKRETPDPPPWPSVGVPRITAEVPVLPY